MTQYTLAKDGFLTLAVLAAFGGLFLIAHAYHENTEPQPPLLQSIAEENEPEFFTELPLREPETDLPPLPAEEAESDKPAEDLDPVEDIQVAQPEQSFEAPSPVVQTQTAPKKDTSPTLPEPVLAEPASYAATLAALIVEQTNAFRKAHGLPSLSLGKQLKANSQSYSQSLLRRGVLSHTDAQGCDLTCRFENYNYEAYYWGENLAMISFSTMPSADEVAETFMSGWEKSSGHRRNLLSDDFTHQGIGISINENSIYVAVQFAQPM